MTTTLQRNTKLFLTNGIKTVAHQHQQYFMTINSASQEKGLRMIIDGLEMYCDAYQRDNGDSLPGEDGYVGPLLEEIIHGLHNLLSAQGKFDGGTISKTICEIAEINKLEI